MNSKLDIDWIVQEVVRRLLARTARLSNSPAGETFIDQRVISIESIRKLGDAKTLSVPSNAIVTPAVKDELKKLGVELTRRGMNSPVANRTLYVGHCGTRDELKLNVTQHGFTTRSLGNGSAEAISRKISGQLGQGDKAIVVCDQPSAAVMHANRFSQLRAMWGVDVAAVNSAKQSIDANVMVIKSTQETDSPGADVVTAFLEGNK